MEMFFFSRKTRTHSINFQLCGDLHESWSLEFRLVIEFEEVYKRIMRHFNQKLAIQLYIHIKHIIFHF